MKTTFNNYDTSKTGTDIDLSVFCDTQLSRDYFEENFSVIQHSGYQKTACYFYTDCGQVEKPDSLSDCYDFSECTKKDFRAFCIDYCEQSPRDTIEEKFYRFETWQDFAKEILNSDIGIYEACRDGFPTIKNAKERFYVVGVSGYSQGDYALILCKENEYLSDTRKAQSLFTNLLYDCPICCRLTVNNEEYFLDHDMRSSYEYDTEEILTIAKKQGVPAPAIEFLEENLPENPEYI